MKLFELFATMSLDTGDFDKGIKSATKQGQSFAGAMQSKLSAGTIAMGNLMTKGFETAASTIGSLVKRAFTATGELEQNLGGSEAVWGEWADEIQAMASHAFSNLGLSMSDYLAEANKMGSLLKGSGYTTAEAYQLTTDVMQRASDVASIMGIDVSAAMQAVEGAAKGNFTMMDNLGVAINDTALANYAMEKGIKKSTKSMTTQEKVALAFQLFMEKTADYAGNYTKENETLSGSFTTLSAAFDNFLTGQGTVDEFVDAVESAARVSLKTLGDVIPRLASSASIAIQKAWPKIKVMLGEWAQNGFDKGAELIASIYNGLTGGNITPEDVKGVFQSIIDEVNRIAGNVISFGQDAFQWIIDNKDFVLAAIGGIAAGFLAFKLITDPVGTVINLIITGLAALVANWEEVKTAIDNAIKSIREFLGLAEHDTPVSAGQTFGNANTKAAVDAWTATLTTGDEAKQQEAWARAQAALGGAEAAASFQQAYTEYLLNNNLEYGAEVPAEWFDGTAETLQAGLDEMELDAEPTAAWSSDTESALQHGLNAMGLHAIVTTHGIIEKGGAVGKGFATGLDYVPYNDYIARLHEGEAVLTKAEATQWRKGGVASEPKAIDYNLLGQAVATALSGMAVQMDGQAVGMLVAPTVSRSIGKQTLARQHTR